MEKSPEACKLDFEDLGMEDTRKYLKVEGGAARGGGKFLIFQESL